MDDTILGPDWPPKLEEEEPHYPITVRIVCGDGKRKTFNLEHRYIQYWLDKPNKRFTFTDYTVTIDNPPLGFGEKIAIVYETDFS